MFLAEVLKAHVQELFPPRAGDKRLSDFMAQGDGCGTRQFGPAGFRWAASQSVPFFVNRYFCRRLLGLSGMVRSIRFSASAGAR
jgi:hypothetical protein